MTKEEFKKMYKRCPEVFIAGCEYAHVAECEDNLWCDVRDIFIKDPHALQTLPKLFAIMRKSSNNLKNKNL